MSSNSSRPLHMGFRWLCATTADPEEHRAFLQKRVALFVGLSFVLWMAIAVVSQAAALAWLPPGGTGALRPMLLAHVAITCALALAWAVARFGAPSAGALSAIDWFAALAQGAAAGAILPHTIVAFRADLGMVMGFSFVTIARASVVPSSALRTFAVGCLGSVPIVMGTWLLYRDAAGPPLPPVVAATQAATWSLLGALLSAVISRVIYGLRREARENARLGQYVLESKIGQGGMGAVFRARHALLKRPTAIKVLNGERADEAALARFEREVQLTSEISHPNVVSVYDYGRSLDGSFYYAMELLDGVDLQVLVERDGPQPPGRVVHLLSQAAEALAEAHAAGLIHRDVKPGNIVLCRHARRPDHVKVLDFGLVKRIDRSDPELSAVDAIAGTPLYLAPECITAPDAVDERSDLYGLGAVGYYLLTGEPVRLGGSVVEVLARALHEPVVPPSERLGQSVPASLERVVLACLAKNPSERPPNASALCQRLLACDDVPPWTTEDARCWWQTRGEALAGEAHGASADVSPFSATLAVAPRPLPTPATRAAHEP